MDDAVRAHCAVTTRSCSQRRRRTQARWHALLPSTLALVLLLSLSSLLTLCTLADKLDVSFRRGEHSALLFGEPKLVRAVDMYASSASARGDSSSSSYIHLRLAAEELVEQLRLVNPYEHQRVSFDEAQPAAEEAASRRLLDEHEFPSSNYSQPGFVQAHVLALEELDLLGIPDPAHPMERVESYCCTPFYISQGLCPPSELGALVVDRAASRLGVWSYDLPLLPRMQHADGTRGRSEVDGGKWIERSSFEKRSAREEARATAPVRFDGTHVLLLSHCDPTLNTEVDVWGLVEWRNPFGFLPGSLWPLLRFHASSLAILLLLSGAFGAAMARAWDSGAIGPPQWALAGLLLLSLLESAVHYGDFAHFNSSGTRLAWMRSSAAVLAVVRQGASRVLLLVLCGGWGTLTRGLESQAKLRLGLLSLAYVLCNLSLSLLGQAAPQSDALRLLLAVPVACAEALWLWWSFARLYASLCALEERKHERLFGAFRALAHTLLAALVAAVAAAAYHASLVLGAQWGGGGGTGAEWTTSWLAGGVCSGSLFLLTLGAVLWLFRPAGPAAAAATLLPHVSAAAEAQNAEEHSGLLELSRKHSHDEEASSPASARSPPGIN